MDISAKARPRLIVMVKEPRPGRVKTRLGADLGLTTSAWWFRHQTAALLRRLEDPRWELIVAVSPDREGLQSRIWPSHLMRIPQGSGDLGPRMLRLLNRFRGPTCVIGGDIPDIQRHHIADSFALLGSRDIVFGPSTDGGFWLLGARGWPRLPLDLFQGVAWSTEHTLEQSVACLRDRRIGFSARLSDVDCVADLVK